MEGDGKFGTEYGETKWKQAVSVVIKESKIRIVFLENTQEKQHQLTCCCGSRDEVVLNG